MSGVDRLVAATLQDGIPPDERRDIMASLQRQLLAGATSSDFLPSEAIDELVLWSKQPDVAAKAITLSGTHWQPGAQVEKPNGRQAVLYLGDRGVEGPGRPEPWRSKPMSGGLEFLKWAGERIDVHRAILGVRRHQARAYTQRYRDNDNVPVGYRVALEDGSRMTKALEREAEAIYDFLEHGGSENDPIACHWDLKRRGLSDFCDAWLDDTLTMDAAPIEIERAHNGKPVGFYNVPGDTVRLAYEDGYEGDDRIVAVQLDPWTKQPVVGFERDELVYPIRNHRTGLERSGYGHAELEDFIRAATAYLNAFTFNAASMDRRQMPRGFLQLFGDFNARTLAFFQQQWAAQFTGPANSWLLPILAARDRQTGGARYVKLDDGMSEMLMTKFLIFCVSLGAALHGMDPAEVNMESFSARPSTLGGNDTAEKLQSSRDRGFIPLMRIKQGVINRFLVAPLNPKFVITWVGLYPQDEARKQERLKLVATRNEVRAIDGWEPIKGPEGDAPVNRSLLPLYMNQHSEELGMDDDPSDGGDPHFGLPSSERPVFGRDPEERSGRGSSARPGTPERGGRDLEAAARRHEGSAKSRLVVEIRELPPAEATS